MAEVIDRPTISDCVVSKKGAPQVKKILELGNAVVTKVPGRWIKLPCLSGIAASRVRSICTVVTGEFQITMRHTLVRVEYQGKGSSESMVVRLILET